MGEVDPTEQPAGEVVPTVEDKTVEHSEAAGENGETETDNTTGEKQELEVKSDSVAHKTSGKIDDEKHQKNRKFDPSVREITDNPDAIRKQVEFYFGDWNFPQDKFMWETCGGSENKPVPIEKLHSFKRMRCFQPYSAVVEALQQSEFLEVFGEEGKEVVKRKVPYKSAPAYKAKTDAATVYVKGFGDEEPDTQFELESFFAKYGEVKGLKLRRTQDNLFKSSVFVTFVDEETAKNFIGLDPTPKWKDHDLKVMSKHDYCEEKSDLIRQGKLVPNGVSQKKFFEGKDLGKNRGGRGRGGNNQGSRDSDWKKRRENDQRNGFQDRRGGGRGRGNRGRGGRGGRGGRDGRDRGSRNEEKRVDAAATNAKRPRDEDDGPAEAPAVKKVDTKED